MFIHYIPISFIRLKMTCTSRRSVSLFMSIDKQLRSQMLKRMARARLSLARAILFSLFCRVNGRQGMSQSGNGLYTDMHYQWFTIGNTPLDATCVIGQVMPAVIFSMAQDIMYMRTRLARGGKTRANLYPLG